MLKHTKKVAVVTGGTGSLGQSVVARLYKEGHTVIVPYRNSARSQEVVNELQQRYPLIDFKIADIESEHSVTEFYSYIFDKYEQIDILCNLVGGVSEKKWVEETSFDAWKMMLGLNLHSCFLMIQATVGGMKKKRFGRIITIGAITAVHPESKKSSYSVAKAGVIALTRSVAMEIKHFGDITANVIVPSIIVTEENKKWGSDEEIKKWITPDEIAEMIVYLISDSGRGINGQVLEMYGKV
jgi:NAD(P)-dependent dehydrogenase (short-subunit alcohol dehydrogenase family)